MTEERISRSPLARGAPAREPVSAEASGGPVGGAGAEPVGLADIVVIGDVGDEIIDPIEHVRQHFEIEDALTDVTIAASLTQIAGHAEPRERWLAAFASPLGKHLALRGGELNARIDALLGVVNRHQERGL
jgi:hypothetical protein